mmetsp:Transcript_22754/g.70367  ORF Transcript_22754/g.70367 Transcript_22754/m.70367 type:complete len:361 (-) Transcript_22754:52-1134(-)
MDVEALHRRAMFDDFDELTDDSGIEMSRAPEPEDPAALERALAASREERRRSAEAMDEALQESRVYEESRATEARRRRFAAEDAERAAKEALAALNAKTADAVAHALQGDADASAALKRAADAYAREAAAIKERQRATAPAALCRNCDEFYAVRGGLCSGCRARRAEEKAACGPENPLGGLFRKFRKLGRQSRRQRLPSPPTPHDRRTGRELLGARLARHGRRVVDVGGDGACQFRAVAHGLWGDESHHALVREKAMEVMRTRPPLVFDCQVYVSNALGAIGALSVEDHLDEYLMAMSDSRSWGDHNTLQACADAYKARILLVTTHEDNYDIKLEPRDEEAISEIWIGFHSEMHYVSTAA